MPRTDRIEMEKLQFPNSIICNKKLGIFLRKNNKEYIVDSVENKNSHHQVVLYNSSTVANNSLKKMKISWTYRVGLLIDEIPNRDSYSLTDNQYKKYSKIVKAKLGIGNLMVTIDEI